jgi:hypothetical protein
MFRKQFLVLFLALLLSLSVHAITVSDIPTKANLGDLVSIDVTVEQPEDMQALLSVILQCPNVNLPFYTNFIELSANQSKTSTVPGITFISIMEGQCSFLGQLKRLDNSVIEERATNSMEVTSTLPFTASFEEKTYDPGENIKITGDFSVTYDNFDYAELQLKLGGTTAKNITKTSFSKTLRVPDDAPAGSQTAKLSVSDAFGNKGVVSLPIQITQIPSAVLVDLNRYLYTPNETMQAVVNYVDQANTTIPDPISVKLEGPKQLLLRDVLDEKTVTDNVYTYRFGLHAEPGDYRLTTTAGEMTTVTYFSVSVVKDLSVTFDDSRVIIFNSGNVKYDDDITINIPNSEEAVTNAISLTPGIQTVIDLSKYAVESGEQPVKVTFSRGGSSRRSLGAGSATEEQQSEQGVGTTAGSASESNSQESTVSDTVHIEKKGIFRATGAAVAGVVTSPSLWAFFLVVGAIVGSFIFIKKKGFGGGEPSEDIDLSKVQQAMDDHEITPEARTEIKRVAEPVMQAAPEPKDEDIVVELDDD